MSTLTISEPATAAEEVEELSAIEILTWLGQSKRLIAVVTGITTTVALATALLLPPRFSARTTLLPPGAQQQSGSAAALAALGQLGGLAGGLGAKTPDELYAALLRSDSVLRSLDEQFQLRDRYKVESFTVLKRLFVSVAQVSSDKKSGVITVEVEDKDPQFAADLANAHFKALSDLLSRLAVSEAKQRRLFFEEQLKETKEHLIQAEQAFKKIQQSSGVIVLDKQAEALISGAASLRAQIATREVQMKVLRTGATEQNPEVRRLSSELAALRTELTRIESNSTPTATANGSISVSEMPVGKIPEAAIDYVRAKRELKLQETLLEGIVKQYEIAKLDEAKEGQALQQIDVATPPDAKSKPSRAMILMSGLLIGLFAGCLWAVMRGALSKQSHSTESLQALRAAWRWK
jgi:capsule polysaccharide export protein KpsE/RkpR